MKNGTILLFKTTEEHLKKCKWYERAVLKSIGYITGSPFDHVGYFANGYFYESGHPYGSKKTKGYKKYGKRYIYKELCKELTESEANSLQGFGEEQLKKNLKYNHVKLFAMALIYPTRWFWDFIKWCPFQNDFLNGMFCSVFTYEAFLSIGLKALPGRYKETIAPGDFLDSVIHKAAN